MKKNDWILIIAVALYSFLFYQQTAGINFLLFSIFLTIALALRNTELIKKRNWQLAALGSIVSAACIGYYGNTLSIIANVISLSLLSALSFNDRSSVVLSLLFSFYSYFTSVVYIFIDYTERRKKQNLAPNNISSHKILLIIVALFVTLLFFFMYRASNPLFDEFTNKINISFISWSWITFTLGGFLLLYGFFYHKKIKELATFDENLSSELKPGNFSVLNFFGRQLSITDEDFSGKVLFSLLNALLLIVNMLDINFFITRQLPDGLTYSEFVHQGTGMLIISIVFAIAIILFYFRGALNFYEKSNTIKLLVYFWILQNSLMLVSTALRNGLYINEYGLTYKRIGVYVYLFLTLIGLLTTLVKIIRVKSNHYLFRINGWLFYSVLILSCFFNWDLFITNYNIQHSKWLEKNYLLKLSDTNLPQLISLQQDTSLAKKEFVLKKNAPDSSKLETLAFDKSVGSRLYWFMYFRQSLDWRSWYMDSYRVYNDLVALNTHGKIKTINLSNRNLTRLHPIKEFNNINELHLESNQLYISGELAEYISLKKLNIANNRFGSIKGIENLKNLEFLKLNGNPIFDYSPLYNLNNLQLLYVNLSITDHQYNLLKKHLPNTDIYKI